MRTAIYPGSFDPITNGHLDVLERGCRLFDRIIVTVARNISKTPLFSADERVSMIADIFGELDAPATLEVEMFEGGLLVEYAIQHNATAIIRGLRAVSDFEYEMQMALMNRKLAGSVSTVFLMPHEKYIHLSSSIIREVASLGGDVSSFVPSNVNSELKRKFLK